LEKNFREHNDYDFDAERFYRESEAAVEKRTTIFKKPSLRWKSIGRSV
jgi:hypothetical protein